MNIIQQEHNGIVCVTIMGRMEAHLAPEFEKVIKKIVASDRGHLLFDLSSLDYLRSSVLRVILNAVKEINRQSGQVVLCCLNGYVREIFEVNPFEDAIAISDSVESGIQTLQKTLNAAYPTYQPAASLIAKYLAISIFLDVKILVWPA